MPMTEAEIEEAAAEAVEIETPRPDFDVDSYDRCNGDSIKAILKLCVRWQIRAIANRRRYGVDVRAGEYDFELACREKQWLEGEPTFMHPCINLEEGKKKYWLAWPRPVHYVIVRADFKAVGICWSDRVAPFVRPDNLENKPNRRSKIENFYNLPYHLFDWFDVDTGERIPTHLRTVQLSKNWLRRNLPDLIRFLET